MAKLRADIFRFSLDKPVEPNEAQAGVIEWESVAANGEWATWDETGDDYTFRTEVALLMNARRTFPLPRERVRPIGFW